MRRLLGHPAGSIFLGLQLACLIWTLLAPESFRYFTPQNLTLLMRAVLVRDWARWIWRCPYAWVPLSVVGFIVAFSAWEWVLPHS